MNCQEVTDLMQRYLDQDLNEQEHSILMGHLSGCSNCSILFEKLKQLSDGLTQLPKVEPPFSLVDQIMPQLDQLDKESKQAVSVVIPWGNRIKKSYKAIAGIAVAAVIFSILIVNGLPGSFQSADNSAGTFDMSSATSVNSSLRAEEDAPPSEMMESFTAMDSDDRFASSMEKSGALEGESESNRIMVTNEHFDSMEFVSPNGEYTAYISQEDEDSLLRIVVVNQQNEEIYVATYQNADQIINIQWSENNQFLAYEVEEGETTTLKEINISNQ